MGLVLKETLKKFCCKNGWSYGVFWSFDQRNSMLLTVEDSYFEEHIKAIFENMLLQDQILGEGIVGEAALSGKNKWIYSDANNGGWNYSGSKYMSQDDLGIQWQFSCGLKTVAVVPVDSRGVLQFGSTHKILETSEFLDHTKRLFNGVENFSEITRNDNPSSSFNYENCDLNEWFSSFCNGNITPMYGGSSCNELMEIAFSSDFQQEKMEPLCLDSTNLASNPQFPQFSSQSAFPVANFASETPCFSTWSNEGSILTSMDPQLPSQVEFKVDDFEMKCNPFEWFASMTPESSIQKVAPAVDEYVSCSGGANSVSSSIVSQGGPFAQPTNSVQSSITDAYFCGKQQNTVHLKDAGSDFGVGFQCRKGGERQEDMKVAGTSVNGTAKKGLFSELGLEELLNGGTNLNANSGIDDRFSNAKKRRSESSSVDDQAQVGSSITMQASYHKDEFLRKSQVGLWIDDSYSINNGPGIAAKPKKLDEPTKATRKRAKPGESSRPRPKDRQQIQDRMKELKELVPDGGKCSIDALLDRTIKYMLFLQSVTKYADKIKQIDEPKLIGEANNRKIPKENMNGGGTTWAIEVGGDESMACPIIVEDLSTPGLMLIEMLCDNRGFFLEIADVVRGFGLNVLKGVMETRDDKIWAHFIVEAKTNITRIDILWSLVQLLQLTSTRGMDSTDQPNNGMNSKAPSHLNSFEQSPLPCPISVAETFQ
ncbi:transcription factor-related [Euphorbia peplus]|nr:transcription factor-related [Euphorbia peplus]